MDSLLTTAFRELFPSRQMPSLSLKYSGKFKDYNATVHMTKRAGIFLSLEFRLSKKFIECDESIRIGVIQHLLNRVYKTTKKSLEQDLYKGFLENVTRYAPRVESDLYLQEKFAVLNDRYFSGLMEQPNLVFGKKDATTVLGHYNYTSDTVTISPVLKEREDLLLFVLYHELLHKKHGAKTSASGRSQYHTPAFRRDEKLFHIPNSEKELERFVRKKKLKKAFSWF
jgi:hypothetical protein